MEFILAMLKDIVQKLAVIWGGVFLIFAPVCAFAEN
jgi:hypothetical protein